MGSAPGRRAPTRTALASLAVLTFGAVLTLGVGPVPAAFAQERPPIGVIDFYGLGSLSPERVRAALGFAEGDLPASLDLGPGAESRIAEELGVARVALSTVCCTGEGESLVYVGIDVDGRSLPRFRPAPEGDVEAPPEVLAAYEEMERRWRDAVLSGQAREDHSQGHSLSTEPHLRELQESFPDLAVRHADALVRTLREAPDARHRAAAATLLGYLPDKAAAAPPLLVAAGDSDEQVRNNATRALAILARYAGAHPELGISVDATPFLDQLGSFVWSDRNKATMLLVMTDPLPLALRDELERRWLPQLVEMCAWKDAGHATASCLVLSRVLSVELAGPDRKDEVLAAARRRLAEQEDAGRP